MQKFINIALVVLKIFKVVKSTTFLFTEIKPDVNGTEGEHGRVHPITFCGRPSKISRETLFYIYLKTYYSIDPFHHGFLKFFFDKCLTLTNCQSN